VQPQEKGAASERLEDERGEEWGNMRDKEERKEEGKKEKITFNVLTCANVQKSLFFFYCTSTTVATIVILNTTTDATVTQDLQHILFSSFPSQAGLVGGGGG